MSGPALFYDDYDSALRDDVQALGGAKTVGPMLWPEKDPLAARNKLNDCLNGDRRERLTHEQEDFIIRKARELRGYSAAIYHRCDETGFKRPEPKDPEDEAAKLHKELLRTAKEVLKIFAQLEQNGTPLLRAVKP